MGKRIIVAACLVMAACSGAMAQENGLVQDRLLSECRSLFAAGQYRQVELVLERMDRNAYRQAAVPSQELDYMRAVAAANVDLPHAGDMLASFLNSYPGSVYTDKIRSLMGWYYLQARNYEGALECYDQCDMMKLDKESRARSELNQAITLLRLGRTSEGLELLKAVDRDNLKANDADLVFYTAFASYQNGDYAAAREGFEACLDGIHSDEARLYLAQIGNEKNENDAVAALGLDRLAGQASDYSVSLEAKRLLGESMLQNGNAANALEPLSEYVFKADSLAQPYDLYMLGLAYYRNGDWDNAVRYLAPVSEGNGELAQNAAMHMGLASLQKKDNAMARMSFQRASQLVGRDEVRGQALYNYGMSLIDGPSQGLASAISVLETFLNDYPGSANAGKAQEALAMEYDFSTDYDAALASIARIKNPGDAILKAKQNLLFRKGLENFQNGQYEAAVKLFRESEKAVKADTDTARDLPFWSAESNYRLGDMKQAEQDYLRYLGKTGSKVSKYTDLANYGLAYIYFNNADYSRSLDFFARCLSVSNRLPVEMKSDALLRRGDCQLNRKQYDMAMESYERAMSESLQAGDYALNQMASIYGLKQMYGDKTRCLERLVQDYPLSQYVPQALYEIGHTYQQTGSSDKAIDYYSLMVERYPASDLARRASVETALIYYQTDRYDKAIEMYKKVIEEYPGSNEARTAMADLRSIYVETGKVDQFIDYTQNTGGVPALETNQRDSLTYAQAENMFSRGDTRTSLKLFQDYISQYPDGAFKADAKYYMGVIYEKDNDYDRAIDSYLAVAGNENSRFATQALQNASSMAYAAGDWALAMDSYIRLFRKSSDPDVRRTSAARIVMAAGQLGEFDAVMDYSQRALESNPQPADKIEIQYWTAKAQLAQGKDATALLESLSADLRSQRGAECDYLLSQYLYDKGSKDKAKDNVMNLVNQGTPHIYWLARSLVLLSDILKSQGQDVEARQYLISLKSNYTENDDIQKMIEERLK